MLSNVVQEKLLCSVLKVSHFIFLKQSEQGTWRFLKTELILVWCCLVALVCILSSFICKQTLPRWKNSPILQHTKSFSSFVRQISSHHQWSDFTNIELKNSSNCFTNRRWVFLRTQKVYRKIMNWSVVAGFQRLPQVVCMQFKVGLFSGRTILRKLLN